MKIPPILEVGGILISSDILTEYFCCDYEKCKGVCCVEGSDGAPVTMEEIAGIEEVLDAVWGDLSASAQSVIDKQGVAYTDQEGDLVMARTVCSLVITETTASAPWRKLCLRNLSAVPSTLSVRRSSLVASSA